MRFWSDNMNISYEKYRYTIYDWFLVTHCFFRKPSA